MGGGRDCWSRFFRLGKTGWFWNRGRGRRAHRWWWRAWRPACCGRGRFIFVRDFRLWRGGRDGWPGGGWGFDCGIRRFWCWRSDLTAAMGAGSGRRREVLWNQNLSVAVIAAEFSLVVRDIEIFHMGSVPEGNRLDNGPCLVKCLRAKHHDSAAVARTESSTSRHRWFSAGVPMDIRTQSGSL